jgi:hypothetical protein
MSDAALGILGASIIGAILISMAFIFLISSRKYKELESLLSNSRLISYNQSNLSGLGVIGQAVRTAVIAMAIVSPNLFISKGLIDKNDMAKLSNNMRLLIVTPWAIAVFSGLCMVFFQVYMKFYYA